jgi:hypothetical protein
VKFVKRNFLYGRIYHDLETLRAEAIGWLERTGNGMPHTTTRKIPLQEWALEKPHLHTWIPISAQPSYLLYVVRKDHTVSFRGNFYSVPQGTYKKGAQVRLALKGLELHIHDDRGAFLCKHLMPEGRGHSLINNNHKRDRTQKIDQLITQTAARFQDPARAKEYLERIRKERGRYIRDHVQAIADATSQVDATLTQSVLDTCLQENYLSATLFRELLAFRLREAHKEVPDPALAKVILLDPHSAKKAAIRPDTSSLDTYEQAFQNG